MFLSRGSLSAVEEISHQRNGRAGLLEIRVAGLSRQRVTRITNARAIHYNDESSLVLPTAIAAWGSGASAAGR